MGTLLEFAIDTAKGAGLILKKGFNEDFEIKEKSAGWDLVTEYDFKSENYILDQIKKKFSAHGVIAEETGISGNKKSYWVIDPIDGTKGFARHVPVFTILIAFVHNGQIEIGVIHDPMTGDVYSAKLGRGAYLGKRKISVSGRTELEFAVGSAHLARPDSQLKMNKRIFNLLLDNGMTIWNTPGSGTTLGWLAAGNLDYSVNSGGGVWDYAGPSIILKEAGAKVTDWQGKPWKLTSENMLVANPTLHAKLFKELKSIISN